jgi:hypothetical protein
MFYLLAPQNLPSYANLFPSKAQATVGLDPTSITHTCVGQPVPLVPDRPVETRLPALSRRRGRRLGRLDGPEARHGTHADEPVGLRRVALGECLEHPSKLADDVRRAREPADGRDGHLDAEHLVLLLCMLWKHWQEAGVQPVGEYERSLG